jgi:hypothetical protein
VTPIRSNFTFAVERSEAVIVDGRTIGAVRQDGPIHFWAFDAKGRSIGRNRFLSRQAATNAVHENEAWNRARGGR